MGITIDFGKTCRYGVVAVAALSGLAGMPTGYVSTAHSAQVTETWMGGTAWSTGTWNPTIIPGDPHYPNNGVDGNTYNVLINNGDYVSLNVNPTIDNLTISSGSGLIIADNKSLRLSTGDNSGIIANNGILSLNSTGQYTYLYTGNAKLTGTGRLSMSNYATNRVLDGINNARLTNDALHTIAGSGSIGSVGHATTFTNLGTVTANQSTPLSLTAGIVNTGILQADGGTLELRDAAVTNSGGTIQGLGISSVDLSSGTTISGGTLAGNIRNSLGSVTLTALANTGAYTALDSTTTRIGGHILNDGLMALASTGQYTTLSMSNATLTGTGRLTMSDQANNRVLYGNNNAVLTNDTLHTIEGSGSIGSDGHNTTFINLGTVTANQSTPLSLTAGIVNTGTLQADGGTLSLVDAAVTNSGGTIRGVNGSSVNLSSGTTITGGILAGNIRNSLGSVTLTALANTGTYTAVDGRTTTISGSILNDGLMELASAGQYTTLSMSNATLTGAGRLTMSNQANNRVLYGDNGARLTNDTLHTIEGSGSIGSVGHGTTFTNLGVVTADQSVPLTLTAGIVNTGFLQAAGGTLKLHEAAVTNTGTIQGLGMSTVDLSSGTTITGGTLAGNIRNSLGNVTLTGLTNTGAYTALNGTTTKIGGNIINDGLMELASTGQYTTLSMNNATLTGAGRLTMSNQTNNRVLFGDNGARLTNDTLHTIEGSGSIGSVGHGTTFTNLGVVTANQSTSLNLDGTVTNTGTFQAESGSNLFVNNTLTNLSGGTLTGGTYTIAGTMRLPGAVNTNAATIVLDGTNSQFQRTGGANALANFSTNTAAGDFTIKNGRDFTTASGNFSNAGDMTFESGSSFQLGATGPSTYTQSAGGVTTVNGTIEADSIVNNGGTLDGTGIINGSVTSNGGTLAPGNSPGTLTINGDLLLDSASTTLIEIGGTSIGEYDVLNISGTANLAGSLDISLWDWTDDGSYNPFTPTAGDFFDIISAESILGSLTLRNVAPLGNALTWRVDYLYADNSRDIVRLSVESTATPTPEPSTLLLFGTGLMSCMGLIKRKKKKAAIAQPAA